jgi:hypothetical protein
VPIGLKRVLNEPWVRPRDACGTQLVKRDMTCMAQGVGLRSRLVESPLTDAVAETIHQLWQSM